jgi:hypothetical protein
MQFSGEKARLAQLVEHHLDTGSLEARKTPKKQVYSSIYLHHFL